MSDYVAPALSLSISERPTIDLDVQTERPWWQYLIDRNPCFLLSGLSMFAGCFLISREIHATDPSAPGFLKMLVGLVVVLNLYEAAVIGLGLWLSRSGELVRDARHLLGLAVLLLIDVGFVYQETATASLVLGGTIAGIAAVLAVGKLYVLTRLVGVRLRPTAGVMLGLSLIGIYTMPVGLRWVASDGFLSLPVMMGVWTLLGVVLAGYAIPGQWARLAEPRNADHAQLQRLLLGGMVALPVLSLTAHAAMGMWVYGSAFSAAMLSPVILGATAVILRHHASLGGAQPAARAACVMVLAAVVAAALPPGELVHVFESLWPSVSPLRGVLLIAPMLLLWAWWLSGGVVLLVYAAVLAISGMLGHTLGVMRLRLIAGWDWLWQMLALLLPDDRLGWGFAGVLLAFLLLAVGGGASWARQRIARRRSQASGLLIPE